MSLVADVSAPDVIPRSDIRLGRTQWAALGAAGVTLIVLMYGLTQRGWYLVEMSALFLALALAVAVIGRIAPDRAAVVFGKGAAELTMTALLIGFARAIQIVLDDCGVIDTIVHGLSVPLEFVESRHHRHPGDGQGALRFVLPFMLKVLIASAVALVIAVWIGYE